MFHRFLMGFPLFFPVEVEARWLVIWLHRARAKLSSGDYEGAIQDASHTLQQDGRILSAHAVRGAE